MADSTNLKAPKLQKFPELQRLTRKELAGFANDIDTIFVKVDNTFTVEESGLDPLSCQFVQFILACWVGFNWDMKVTGSAAAGTVESAAAGAAESCAKCRRTIHTCGYTPFSIANMLKIYFACIDGLDQCEIWHKLANGPKTGTMVRVVVDLWCDLVTLYTPSKSDPLTTRPGPARDIRWGAKVCTPPPSVSVIYCAEHCPCADHRNCSH